MTSVVNISKNPLYDDTRIIIRQILRLGNAIKRDVSRLVAYQSEEHSDKIHSYIMNCKRRILERLATVDSIRHQRRIQNEDQWKKILYDAMSQIYRHSDSPDFRRKIQLLLSIDSNDATKTGIEFLQIYMRIVARIPEDQMYTPFKP